MINNLFNSRFGQYMTRLGDLLLLQVVFLLTSLPVFTAGAGIAALYTVFKKLHTDAISVVLPTYFAAFKANFKKATLLWLALLASGALLYVDYRYFQADGEAWFGVMRIAVYVIGTLWYLLFLYAFPLEAWYDNAIGKHLANSIRLALSHLGTTLLLTAVNALFLALVLYAKALVLLIGASGCIYLKTLILGRLLFPEQFRKQGEDGEAPAAEPREK